MNRKEPLDQLAGFYQSLDSIPTPPLAIKRPWYGGYWSFALAPFGAALLAFGFITFCATGPTQPSSATPIHLTMDRYALHEIQADEPPIRSHMRATVEKHIRSLI